MEHTVSKFPEQKEALYKYMKVRLSGQVESCPHVTANLANASALLNQGLKEINWVGFYLLEGETLVLGPFQGKPACAEIPVGKGVCGTAVLKDAVIRVEDVHQFPGHIACDSASRSEIVLPLHDPSGKIRAVLDIDSPVTCRFTGEDQKGLESLVPELEKIFGKFRG